MPAEPARPRLLTIPISHFCEKARWALERAGVDYEEQAHLQLVHRLERDPCFGGRARPGGDEKSIRGGGEDLRDADLVVFYDRGLRPQLAEVLDEVVGEGVVVVDDEDAAHVGISGERQSYHRIIRQAHEIWEGPTAGAYCLNGSDFR